MAVKMPVRLAAFDIAGTLVKDTGIIVRSFIQALEMSHVPASEEEIQTMRGAAKRDVIRHFFMKKLGKVSATTEDEIDKTYSTFRQLLEANFKDDETEPIPGAESILDWLRKMNIKIGTTSGFYTEIRDIVLKKLGWDGAFFDCNVCSDDVPRGRPAPYMIFECMSQLGIADVGEVIVIGDTPLDMQAGTNAGCRGVIGVLSGSHGVDTLGATRHTHIIKSVAELPKLEEFFPSGKKI